MWDYLRRSGANGFLLPLTGGIDGTTVAMMVSFLCKNIYKKIVEIKDQFVLSELRKIIKDEQFYPNNDKEICDRLLVTAFIDGEKPNTKERKGKKNAKKYQKKPVPNI